MWLCRCNGVGGAGSVLEARTSSRLCWNGCMAKIKCIKKNGQSSGTTPLIGVKKNWLNGARTRWMTERIASASNGSPGADTES